MLVSLITILAVLCLLSLLRHFLAGLIVTCDTYCHLDIVCHYSFSLAFHAPPLTYTSLYTKSLSPVCEVSKTSNPSPVSLKPIWLPQPLHPCLLFFPSLHPGLCWHKNMVSRFFSISPYTKHGGSIFWMFSHLSLAYQHGMEGSKVRERSQE